MGRQLKITVLLAEDDALVALDLEYMLGEAGIDVTPVHSIERALEVGLAGVDCILADITLGGESIEPLWDSSREAGVPMVIYTGVSKRAIMAEFPGAPFVPKPAARRDLLWEIVKATTRDQSGKPKTRALSRSRWIAREVGAAMHTLSVPMLEWQSEARKLRAIVDSGRAPTEAYIAATELLAKVEDAQLALERISKDLALEVRSDSRFVDRTKSLVNLFKDLEAVAARAKGDD